MAITADSVNASKKEKTTSQKTPQAAKTIAPIGAQSVTTVSKNKNRTAANIAQQSKLQAQQKSAAKAKAKTDAEATIKAQEERWKKQTAEQKVKDHDKNILEIEKQIEKTKEAILNSTLPETTKRLKEQLRKLEEKLTKAKENRGKYIESNSEYLNDSASVNGATKSNGVEETYMDTSFTLKYAGTNVNIDDYIANMGDGLRVSSLRGILGMPPQFLPLTDPRIDGSYELDVFGRTYAEYIVKNIPLLLLTPGSPSFMTSFSKKDKTTVLKQFLNVDDASFDDLVNGSNGKYYTLKYDYTGYFEHVNTILRAEACYLNIQDVKIDNKKIGDMNWLYYSKPVNGNKDIFGRKGLSKFLGPYAGCVAFYADCGYDASDSFSNATTQSQLASGVNGLSDKAREMNFLIGNGASAAGINLDKWLGAGDVAESIENINDQLKTLGIGNNNVFRTLMNQAQTIMAGGRMIFPEIWSDSSFGRSYSCKMKLIAPYGDKLSVYLSILVPIAHLLCFALPRQTTGQAYFSPYLIRGYFKGLFHIDMGIMTDLQVDKGAEGEWTIDGIPTVAEVSFTIKDLYEGLAITSDTSLKSGIFSNTAELDYIANSCGININEHEVGRMLTLYKYLRKGEIMDKVVFSVFGRASQYLNNKLAALFTKI